MKRLLVTVLIVVAVLAILVVVLTMTPVGWRVVTGIIEGAVEREWGLDLTIGSLRGNLLRGATVDDVRLTVPDGPTIVTVETIDLLYDLPALLGRRVTVPTLRAANAELVFDIGPDGEPVGWSHLLEPAPAETTVAPGEPWPVDVDLELVDWVIVVRDTSAGYEVEAAGLAVRARGGVGDFEASIGGSLRVGAAGLSRPVEGVLSADIEGHDGGVRITRLDVATDEATFGVRGLVSTGGARPELDLAIESTLDLAGVTSLATGEGAQGEAAGTAVRGRVEIAGSVEGPADSIRYRVQAAGRNVVAQGIDVPRLDLDASGDLDRLEVESLEAAVFGGSLSARASVDLTGFRADPPWAPVEGEARLRVPDLARLGPFPPEGSAPPRGALLAVARLRAPTPEPSDLAASFDLAVAGLAVEGASLGELVVSGSVAGGTVRAEARCCSSVVTAEAPVAKGGVGEIAFSAELSDLSVLAAAFGVAGLGGVGTVEGTVALRPAGATIAASASLPALTYEGFVIGPAGIEASGSDSTYDVSFRAFGDVLTGTGTFDTAGRYSVSTRVDSFDLASVMGDSLRDRLEFEGWVTAAVSARGRGQEPPAVAGTVIDLFAGARGERAYLATPFQFEASPDTVHITWASIEGTFGSFSAMGGMGVHEAGEILARFDGIDLAAVANIVPDGPPAPVRGMLDGEVRFTGRRDRPSFTADIGLTDFAFGALELRSITLEAENDSTDIVFDLHAESAAAGSVMAFGSIPVIPDSLRFMLPDRSREFGASVVLSEFEVEAGGWLMPNVRGVKRFGVDGAVLVAGRGDSLGSLHGRGSFGSISATFDLVEFALSEPLDFEIDGGDIELAETAVSVVRRRVLGDKAGGVATIGGVVRGDGGVDLSVTTQGLDVGQLVRAFGPEPRATVEGSLDVAARVTGTLEEPVVDIDWLLDRPAFVEYGFDSSTGRARFAGGALIIEEASLSSGGRSITAAGVIPVPAAAGEAGRPEREIDLRISAEDFRLEGLARLPAGIEALDGQIVCDLTVGGVPSSPLPSGVITLRGGSVRGFGLKEPIRGIEFELRAADGTVAITNARARLGDGSVTAAGFAEIAPGGGVTFWIKTRLESPEIRVEDSFDARLAGSLTWAGTHRGSELSGSVVIEKLDVTYSVGLIDLLTRRPIRVTLKHANDPLSRVALEIDFEVEDEIRVRNSLANLSLRGGFHVGGTALAPEIGGGLYADGGSFKYLENEFDIETLEVVYVDPRRRDPHVHLVGSATVLDRSEEEHLVTVVFEGFAFETFPQLTSSPPLSQPDIVTLLTFGDTFGGLLAGGGPAASSGDRFAQLARGAFVSSLFGVAEATLERMLRLDTVSVDEEAVANEGMVGADVTVGKMFGDRLRVNYTTAVGEFGEREVEVAFRLSKRISIETRADPEGNHAIGLRLRLPFR